MKTSKVKSIEAVNEWSKGEATIYYHNVTMENGDKINIGLKKKLTVGEELNYRLTGEDDGQQEFSKAKRVSPEWEQKNSGGSSNPGTGSGGQDVQTYIIRQNALEKSLRHFEIQELKPTKDQVCALAEFYKNYVFNGLSSVGSKKQSAPEPHPEDYDRPVADETDTDDLPF